MKKRITLFGSIFACLILCSLSYQPVIAGSHIEKINQIKDFIHRDLIKLKSKSDCGCLSNSYPKIICSILSAILILMVLTVLILEKQNSPNEIIFYYLYNITIFSYLLDYFNCPYPNLPFDPIF